MIRRDVLIVSGYNAALDHHYSGYGYSRDFEVSMMELYLGPTYYYPGFYYYP